MNILPSDLASFIWGLVAGVIVIIFSGFGSAAGSDLWHWCKKRIKKEPPEPQEVSQKFSPTLYSRGSCAWVPELDVPEKEQQNWGFYPHLETNGRCYRMAKHGGRLTREFLMVNPEAMKNNAT